MIVVVIGMVAMLFLLGSSQGVWAKPIRVGWIGILSGPGASVGKPILDGSQLAVNEINEAGGVKVGATRRKLEIVSRDSKGRPDEAVRVARELVLKEKVSYIVGPFTDAANMAVSQVSRETKTIIMPYVAKTMNLLAPDNFHPYVFQPSANTKYEAAVAARFMLFNPRWKTVFLVAPDYEYGQSCVREYTKIMDSQPQVEIVGTAMPKLFETDFSPYITQILDKKPDVLHVMQWGGDFITLMKQASTYGVFDVVKQVTAVGEDGTPELTIATGDDYPEGVYANSMELFYYPNTPEHMAYVEGMKKLTGEEYISGYAVQGYIAVQFLAQATENAKSTKSLEVVEALEGLTIETPIGKQTMGKDHQQRRGMFWGLSKSVPEYPFKILDPVEYVPFDESMVR
jgi:branched-chain amino acid transport system substrate-binding protein